MQSIRPIVRDRRRGALGVFPKLIGFSIIVLIGYTAVTYSHIDYIYEDIESTKESLIKIREDNQKIKLAIAELKGKLNSIEATRGKLYAILQKRIDNIRVEACE